MTNSFPHFGPFLVLLFYASYCTLCIPSQTRIAPSLSIYLAMLSEEVISTISGPQIAANTAVPKDAGIYSHTLTPSWAVKATFKKSSAPVNCLAVSDSHVFAAQDQKAHVHVYSRERGNQETLVSFQERIRSLATSGNVLILGTAEGRLILWEVSFGLVAFSIVCCSNHAQEITDTSRPPPAAKSPLRLATCRLLLVWPQRLLTY